MQVRQAEEAFRQALPDDAREAYLTSIHTTGDGWQFNFYHPVKDVLYTVDEEGNVKGPEETLPDVTFLPELDVKSVTIPVDEALREAEAVLDAREQERVEKRLIVLQMAEEDPVWNMSFFLPEGRVVNVHVSARQGGVIKQDRFTLFGRA